MDFFQQNAVCGAQNKGACLQHIMRKTCTYKSSVHVKAKVVSSINLTRKVGN
jgi:hypothetical protein